MMQTFKFTRQAIIGIYCNKQVIWWCSGSLITDKIGGILDIVSVKMDDVLAIVTEKIGDVQKKRRSDYINVQEKFEDTKGVIRRR
jgi:hypothetical protein